jgi:pimeloyl-ACP methyl ester carboxylesterase/uncharacterized protein YegL
MKKNTLRRFGILVSLLAFFVFSLSPSGSIVHAQANQGKIHPVILIHGINTKYEMWREVQSVYYTLLANNYNPDYIQFFAYTDETGGANALPFTDNNCSTTGNENIDADVTDSAKKLNNCIDWLINKSLQNGGPGYVDIVAHSLGGLVTREYIGTHPNHRIRKFIDIATPHQGVPILGLYNDFINTQTDKIANNIQTGIDVFIKNNNFSKIIADLLKPALREGIHAVVEYAWKDFKIGLPNPSSAAGRQLDPQSSFFQQLNGREPLASRPDYSFIYGDIQLGFVMDIFGLKVSSTNKLSMGDMVVDRDNASTIPRVGNRLTNQSNYHSYDFPANVYVGISLQNSGPNFRVEPTIINIDSASKVWHNGLLENNLVSDRILKILEDISVPPGIVTQPPSITPGSPPPPPNNYTNSSTVMLFDTSGSMNDQDSTNVTKLFAAQNAGGRILDIIQAENDALQGAEVAILSFSESGQVNSSLSTDTNSARQALNGLYANGGTGMPNGLDLAINQYSSNSQNKPIIILLSDGMPNIPLDGTTVADDSDIRQQVLDLASKAGSNHVCIYTVGFGIPNTIGNNTGEQSIDEDFLRNVAANSGCGAYYNAQNATELANIYVGLRHESLGNILLRKTGNISQGQLVELGSAAVPQSQSEMLFTLNWPGSRLDPRLIDPKGVVVDPNYPGANFFNSKSLASVIIKNPIQGQWILKAEGVDVPEGTTIYNAILSTRSTGIIPTPTPAPLETGSSFPIAVAIVAMGVVGLLVYIVTVTTKRGRKLEGVAGSAFLIGLSGECQGRTFTINGISLIGRGRECQVILTERAISRQHTKIRFASGQWYLQDLNSSGGTFLNGNRINAARINSGDKFRVGSSEFEFKS